MLKSGFREKGIAKLSRLDQDAAQAFCSDPGRGTTRTRRSSRAEIEAANLATIKWPSDGVWLGNCKAGEAGGAERPRADVDRQGRHRRTAAIATIAISCRRRKSPSERSARASTITASCAATREETLRYTWGKIYNAKAFNACSNMPRAGHMGIITEQQIKDLMALLLDPRRRSISDGSPTEGKAP